MRRGARIREESGVTLVEALVALVVSIVVALAIFAMIDFAFRQTNNVAERVSANQRGRSALETIASRLHSSCVSVGAYPVRAESSGNELRVWSVEGTSAIFTSMTEHRIFLEGTTLYDSSYASSGGTAPNWTFPSSGTKRVLLTNVSQSGSEPIFKYFKYGAEGELSGTAQSVPLEKTEAERTAAVQITFIAGPESVTTKLGHTRSVELTDTVLLRFDPSSTSGQNTPCS